MTRSSTSKFGSYSVAGNATTSTFMRTATNSAFSLVLVILQLSVGLDLML